MILKRPQKNSLVQSLLLKASEKTEKYFNSLAVKIDKIDKHALKGDLSYLNFQDIRINFREKLASMQELLSEKYFKNYSM